MKLSVKKFSKKSLSLLIALIMVFSALPLTTPISADAATVSKSVKVANYGVLSSGGRIDSNVFEIVNDGRNGNFSIGCVRFNISNLSHLYEVTSAMYNISHYANSSRTNNMYIGFYYPTKNLDTYSLTNGSATNSGTFYSNIFNNTNDSNHTHISAAKSYFGLQEITTVLSRADDSTNSVSIDIAPLINYALKNNTTATLMIMLTAYDQTDNSAPWSDRKVTVSTSDFNVTANEKTFSTEVTSSNNANSTTNRVKIGDAIYTRASDSFYNYGKVISTDKFWYTPITTTSNIKKIECLDDGSILTVSNSKLSGTFYDDKFKVSGNKNINATLKFTFTDGKIEYHRVAVKSYPVENHAAVQSWKSRTGGNRESGYTLFLRGSTGSGGTGVFNGFNSYYGTYGTDYSTNSNGGYGNASAAINTSVDKKSGIGFTNQNDAFPTSVGVGTYYIDKSCRGTDWANLGNSELWNGTNYSFKMDIVRTMFVNYLGDYGATSTPRNTTGATVSGSYKKNDTNGYTCTYTFTATGSIKKASDYNYHYNIQNTDAGSAGMRANIETFVFDKSTARNLYKNYLAEAKTSADYSLESFARYQNALLDMEAYLSNYEDTTDATTSQAVYTELVTAHNSLISNYKVNFITIDDFISSNITKTVTVAKGGTVNSSDFPTITATAYSSNNKHNRYYWQNMTNRTEFTSQTVVNSDLEVVETKVEEACKIVNKGIEGDKVNLECSVCKHASTLNASAYNAAVLDAQASIANSQAYSQASRDALSSVLTEQDTAIKKAKTQKEVDNCTSAIVSANQLKTENNPAGKLVYNQYSITVNYVDEKGAGLGTQEITNVNYGTIKDVTANTTFNDKSYVVYKWTRLTQEGDKLFGLNSTSVSVNVVGNLTYYVHLKSTQAASPNDTAVVTLNNKAGKPVDVGYVTTNEAQNVVVNGNSIKIGTDTTLTAPQYSFYSVKGFIVNNELITAESGTKSITVTKDMTIIPLYYPTSYVDITRKSGEIFTINGKDTKSYSARWDELITLETTGVVIWCTTTKDGSEVVLGQGKSFKFRANENIEIYTKQEVASLTPNSRVGYFGYDADLKKVTIVNNFFVPGGANEYVKAGVVVSTKAKTRDEMIAQYNAGSLKFEGGYDKFTADKNQIRITINRNGSGDFSMWALSYVIVDGTTYFADDVISYTYNSPSKTA